MTIKLNQPYNSVADHIAFLHLTSIAPGLHVGSQVTAGQQIGTGGSGPNAAGAQKAALGFAFYHDAYYGYGPTWAQYDGSPQLNPVAFLDGLKASGVTSPPGGGGTPPPVKPPVTSTITAHLKPNADVTDLLIKFDQVMIIDNPFQVASSGVIGGTDIPDPIGWLADFGTNLWNDSLAVGVRFFLWWWVGGSF